MLHARVAPLLVGVNDRFGVGPGPVGVPGGLQLFPDCLVVVDLAVEHDPDRAVLVRERLMPGGEIDDAQPSMAERGTMVGVEPRVIRSAMREHVPHRSGTSLVRPIERVSRNDACYSAHIKSLSAISCQLSAKKWWPRVSLPHVETTPTIRRSTAGTRAPA